MFRKLFRTRFWSSFIISMISMLFLALANGGDKNIFSGLINITGVQLFSLVVIFLLPMGDLNDLKMARFFYVTYFIVLTIVLIIFPVLWMKVVINQWIECWFFNLIWLVACLENINNKK